jgi:spore maturation protein CgeB
VLVHEWNEPELVRAIGQARQVQGGFVLLFHDTHHRAVTSPASLHPENLSGYDGVLAFGKVLRDIYLANGWTPRAFTWHEAADTRVFRQLPGIAKEGDLGWIGNWGDGERTAELAEFLLGPVRDLGLSARVHGVRYPDSARHALLTAGIEYAGWLPNHLAPRAFAAFRVTVHVPRRPYAEALPGIPTIRPFEAMACGMPLVSAPWHDVEGLFESGKDYLCARDGEEMVEHLRALIEDPGRAAALGAHGRRTVNARHTCRHRAEELVGIVAQVRGEAREPLPVAASA